MKRKVTEPRENRNLTGGRWAVAETRNRRGKRLHETKNTAEYLDDTKGINEAMENVVNEIRPTEIDTLETITQMLVPRTLCTVLENNTAIMGTETGNKEDKSETREDTVD